MNDSVASIRIFDIYRNAVSIFKEHKSVYLTFGLIYSGLGVFNNLLFSLLPGGMSAKIFVLSLVNTFLAGWVTMAVYYTTVALLSQKETSVAEGFLAVKKRYWLYIAVSITVGVLTAFGFFLLIVPALIIASIFIFADIMVVVDETGYMESFTKSFDMAKNAFLKPVLFLVGIVALFLLQGLVTHLVSKLNLGLARAIEVVLAALLIPYYMISQVCLYLKFKETFPSDEQAE